MTFIISPDVNLLIWLILISWAVNGVFYIVAGAIHMKKEEYYNWGTSLYGFIILILVLWVLLA